MDATSKSQARAGKPKISSITGFKKDFILFRYILNPAMHRKLSRWIKENKLKKLPWRVLQFLLSQNKHIKLTPQGPRFVLSTLLPPVPSLAFERYQQKQILDFNGQCRPYQINVALTHKCHFNCSHCSRTYRAGEELPTARWVALMKELQDFGLCLIALTGGEPLLRLDLEEIVASIDERSVSVLLTSGDGFTRERAQALKKAGLSYVSISLDHYDESGHNRFRRSDIAFKTALEAIRVSQDAGFYTAVHLTVRKEVINEEFLNKYFSFVATLGVPEIRITEPLPSGNWTWQPEDFFLNDAENKILDDFCYKVQARKDWPKVTSIPTTEREKNLGCSGGKYCMYLDAFGDMFPCDFFQVSFGSIRHEPFESAWKKFDAKFKSPFRKCPLKDKVKQLQALFPKGTPIKPLPSEEAAQFFELSARKELPDYYKNIGWK